MRRASALRPAVVAAVIGLLGVAALASRAPIGAGHARGHPLTGPVQLIAPPVWVIAPVIVIVTIAVVCLLIYALPFAPIRRRRGLRRSTIAALCLPLVAALALAIVQELRRHAHPTRVTAQLATRHPTRRNGPRPQHDLPFSLPSWEPVALVALVLAGGLVLVARPHGRRRKRLPSDDGLTPALTTAVERSLEDLRADPDPRRAIVATYRRLEGALAAAGLDRRSAEASREYMNRVLGATNRVDRVNLNTVTRLFELAKFSVHRVDAAMRDQAIDALVGIREQLGRG